MYEFRLPDVGEGIHEAEIVRWLAREGQTVAQDEPLLEIQTDKALVEIPSPVAGRVVSIKCAVGTVAHLGDLLIVLEAESAKTNRLSSPKNTQQQASPSTTGAPVTMPNGTDRRVLAAPALRKLALEQQIDLNQVSGSGPAGRILLSDLQAAIAQQQQPETAPPTPLPPVTPPSPVEPAATPLTSLPSQEDVTAIEVEPLRGLRRRIAERMTEAWRIPHVTSFANAEVSKLVEIRRTMNEQKRDIKISYLPFIIKAAVQALREFPYFNVSLDMARGQIIHHRNYHIGIATAVPDGLLVPVIHNADQLSLVRLAQEIQRLADLARQRKLSSAQLTGSTFTVSNFGSFGGEQGTPIINPPEVAILGCGQIEAKPWVIEGHVVARPVMPLSLSFDHRLLDGAVAAQFLGRIKALLSEPNLLFMEI